MIREPRGSGNIFRK